MKMLVPAPYKASKKKAEKEAKETRGGLLRRGTTNIISEDFDARSSSKEDEEEEENQSLPARGRKKRPASTHLVAESPKKGRTPLPEESATATNSSPEWDPRVQPLVNS